MIFVFLVLPSLLPRLVSAHTDMLFPAPSTPTPIHSYIQLQVPLPPKLRNEIKANIVLCHDGNAKGQMNV